MERSEKALVPEWLKGANGGTSGGGGSTLHLSASSLQSDDHLIALSTRSSSSSISSCDHDTPRSAFLDRTSPSYFRRSSSSNGAMMREKDPSGYSRPYSTFGRSYRERDREKDLDFWLGNHDNSDSLTHTSRIKKDTLRRSESMISRKQGEVWPRRVGNDTSNGLLVGGSITSNNHKAAFERDFPSLGADEKQGVPDVSRVSSPGLSSSSHNLPIGASAVIGGECWTSVLAELPVTVGSNSTLSSAQHAGPASLFMASNTTISLNMAETLAQTPARTRTTPQVSVETQRLEELAIKQSRQLIPMTPSMPKTSVFNSTEKTKSKTGRSSELSIVTKVGQRPFSSQLVNQTARGTTRPDVSKPSQAGKLTVLKTSREKNDTSPTAVDGLCTTNTSRFLHGVIQSPAIAPLRSPVNAKLAPDRKAPAVSVIQNSSMDRRPLSQAQNRIDFFNSLRRKSSADHSASVPDSFPAVSSKSDMSDDQTTAIATSVSEGKDAAASGPDLEWSPGDDCNGACNGNACGESLIFSADGEKDLSSDAVLFPDEEEAAFLRSMGWEENVGEEAAPLTDEEINAFHELLKLRSCSQLSQGVQQLKIVPFEPHVGSLSGASSGMSSSDSEAEA